MAPRVEQAEPTRAPSTAQVVPFPTPPRETADYRALGAAGEQAEDNLRRLFKDRALLRAAEETKGLEFEILNDPNVNYDTATADFSARLAETHDAILDDTSFLSRGQAEFVLRENAANRTTRFQGLLLQRQESELRAQFAAKNDLRLGQFASVDSPQGRNLLTAAVRADAQDMARRRIFTPAQVEAEVESFRRTGTERGVRRLASVGAFDSARSLAANAEGLPDETRAFLADYITKAEESDLQREDNLISRQRRTIFYGQEKNANSLFGRLSDTNRENDPTNAELASGIASGHITDEQARSIRQWRDNPGGGGGAGGDLAAYSQLELDATYGTITPSQARSRALAMGADRAEISHINSLAVNAQQEGTLGRPDIQGALKQMSTFYPDRSTLDSITGPIYATSMIAARDLIVDRLASRPGGEIPREEIDQIVRQSVVRTFPGADTLPPVIPPGTMAALVPNFRDPVSGNAIPSPRPTTAADIPVFRTSLDLAAHKGTISLEEHSTATERLGFYEDYFDRQGKVSELLHEIEVSQPKAPPPTLAPPKPPQSPQRTLSGLLAPFNPAQGPASPSEAEATRRLLGLLPPGLAPSSITVEPTE